MPLLIGSRVQFVARMKQAMGPVFGSDTGVIVASPLGSTEPPDGGCYVLWSKLREPAPCFEADLEPATDLPSARKRGSARSG